MCWKNALIEDGDLLRLQSNNLIVVKGEIKHTIPLADISIIVVDGNSTTITLQLLNEVSKFGITLLTCNQRHMPTGIYNGFANGARISKMIQRQANLNEEVKNALWKNIVELKIKNQLSLLDENFDSDIEDYYLKIKECTEQVELGDATNREAYAARLYFPLLFGDGFNRRSGNNINIALNYGYAILRAQMARIVVSHGLSPMIGLFHKNEYNAFNLVDDLMEPFRAFVDRLVLDEISDNIEFSKEDRVKLINITQLRCNYKGRSCTLSNVMDGLANDVAKCIASNTYKELDTPNIKDIL